MKVYLIALYGLLVRTAFGQIPDAVPPAPSTSTKVSIARIHNRFRQPPPLPAGGFWMVEENVGAPAVVHYYTDVLHELRVDTQRRKHLNLKNYAVIRRLNRRLITLLDTPPAPASVAVLKPWIIYGSLRPASF